MEKKIIDINYKTVEAYINDKRPPVELRDQIDLGFKFERGAFELFERRPSYNRPDEFQEFSFAKIKYVKTQEEWKLYWMRASGKWQSYDPMAASNSIAKILLCVDEDINGCFYG